MKQCPNCRNQIPEESAFCPVCGTSVTTLHAFPEPYPPQQPMTPPPPVYTPPVVKINPYDHTKMYTGHDVSEHKVLCMLVYLLDFIGIIIGLLAAPRSEYTLFHIRQSMRYTVLEMMLAFAALLLCWTVIVPIMALVFLIILIVIKMISVAEVCGGKAIEPVIIRRIKFLK